MSNVLTEQKDKQLFDTIAHKYAQKDVYLSTSIARKYQLETALGDIIEDKVETLIEVACGVGASAKYLRGKYERYYGIDYSKEIIDIAKRFHLNNAKIKFLVSNVKDLYKANLPQADMILAVGALHHFTELDETIKSLKSVAKPGAWFVAIEPQRSNPLIQLLRFFRGKVDSSYSIDQQYFTKAELRSLLEKHGFSDISLQYQGFFTPPFAQVILYPAWLAAPLARMAVSIDSFLDRYMPEQLKIISWNVIVRARF